MLNNCPIKAHTFSQELIIRMNYTDSHCHLDFEDFNSNRKSIILECIALNISKIIVPTIGPENWQSAIQLCQAYSSPKFSLYPCLGIHPWFLQKLTNDTLQSLENMVVLHRDKLCALGEAGIDGVIAKEQNNLTKQIYFFEFYLEENFCFR